MIFFFLVVIDQSLSRSRGDVILTTYRRHIVEYNSYYNIYHLHYHTASVTSAKAPSIASLSIGETWEDTDHKTDDRAIAASSTSQQIPSSTTTGTAISKSDINIANFDHDIPTKSIDIQQSPQNDTNNPHHDIKDFITAEISTQVQQYFEKHASFLRINELQKTQVFIDNFNEEYKSEADKLRGRMEWVNANMVSYEKKFNNRFDTEFHKILHSTNKYIDDKKNDFLQTVEDLQSTLESKAALLTHDMKKVSDEIRTSHFHFLNLNTSLLPSAETLRNITSQMKNLLKQYQDKTTVLDSTIDVLHDELDTLKADVEQSFRQQTEQLLTSLKADLLDTPTSKTHQPVTPQNPASSPTMFQNKWKTTVDEVPPYDSTTYGFVPPVPKYMNSTSPQTTPPYHGV